MPGLGEARGALDHPVAVVLRLLVPDLAEPVERHDGDELGVDRRAVEALVVVLDDDLPVRRDLVAQPDADPQLVDPVAIEVRDALGALAQCRDERLRRIGQVDEHEPRVRPDRDRVQRVGLAVEGLVLVDVRASR